MTGSGAVPGAGSGALGACRGFGQVGMGSIEDGELWRSLGQGDTGGFWGGGALGVPRTGAPWGLLKVFWAEWQWEGPWGRE